MRLLVHTSHAGGIIGKGGKRIQQLREETKASIKVFTECCPQSNERVISIQGSPDIVIHAMITILEVIVSNPIKGSVQLYDPIHATAFPGLEYGGYADPVIMSAGLRPLRGPTGPVMRTSFDSIGRSAGGGCWPRSSRVSHVRDSLPYAPRGPWIITPMDGGRYRTVFETAYEAMIPEVPSLIHFPAQPSNMNQNSDGSVSTSFTVPNNVST